ncbi:MAG: glycoside hydrolase family 3 protein [Proteobacteria bacterium]|nr:glycoside hydrolase family 3 protein [Pseudomonadota bacterium]
MQMPDATPEQLVESLELDQKLALMSGDPEFWPGLVALVLRDSYHRVPFAAGGRVSPQLPGLHFVDGPRGVVIEGGTMFPVPMARGATWDVELEERIGDAIGKEVRAVGANLYGGVCINLPRHPGWGRAQETYGEDPAQLGAFGVALTRGVQRHALATVKHFALNSMEDMRFDVDVQVSPRVLHELYLPHFREVVDAGVACVMSAYNAVNGDWCGESEPLLRTILKERWGFRGFVLSDFVFGVRDAEKGLRAGLDLEMPYRHVYARHLGGLVRRGEVPADLVDEAALRLVRAQLAVPRGTWGADLLACEAHTQLAREAAQKSIVLLKNDGLILPVDPASDVVLLGALAGVANLGDRGSSDGRPPYTVTPQQGLEAAGRVRTLATDDPVACAAAAATAELAIVVVGNTEAQEGESLVPPDIMGIGEGFPPPRPLSWFGGVGRAIWRAVGGPLSRVGRALIRYTNSFGLGGDRRDLRLLPEHEALIAAIVEANPRTLVVVQAGSTVLMEGWRHRVPGVLMLWYPGMEGGHALADVVFGAVAPSGRMPVSTPTSADHLPAWDPDATRVEYDLWHGYRKLQRDGNTSAFPLGFGLTTTRFSWSGPQVTRGETELLVSVQVANEGPVDADEVVQVYASWPGSRFERPPRQLVGFARAHVPFGEQRRIEVRVPARRLEVFDEALDDLVREDIDVQLLIARHAEDDEPLVLALASD